MEPTLESEAGALEGEQVLEETGGTNRHPWLGVFLNWFVFSGAGYFYCGQYWRAGLAMLASMTIYAFLYGLVFVESLPFNMLLLIGGLSICGLKVGISLDAFRIIRRQNTDEFEISRKSQKDAWLAAFLAVIWPGLGLLYLRKWVYFGLYLVISFFFLDKISEHVQSDLTEKYPGIRYFLVDGFVIGAVATLCFRLAIRPGTSIYTMRTFYRYSMALVVTWGILFLGVLVFAKNVMQVYNVLSGSMEPTIFAGERVLVDKLAYADKKPEPGDIVIFPSPRANESWVKRVVAVSGQKVDVTDTGKLLVDGEEVYYDGIFYGPEDGQLSTWKPQSFLYGDNFLVPKDSCFVIGDNYFDSYDSRHFGPVKEEEIIGKVVRVFDFGWY